MPATAEVDVSLATLTIELPAGADGPATPASMRTQALLPAARYRVTIDAHDLASPVSAVATGTADAATLEVGNVSPGSNRLITVEALDSGNNPVPGAVWRAVATIAAIRQRVALSAGSTALGAVWARWLAAGKKDLAGAQDPSAVAAKLDQIKNADRLPHHAFIDAIKFADAVAAKGSLDVGTSGFSVAPAAIDLTLVGAPGRVSADIWMDDPASPLQAGVAPRITQTPGRYVVAPILPGTWTLRASVPGMGVVSQAVTLSAGATQDVTLAFPSWQPGPDLPTGLGNAIGASDGTRLYVVGGIAPDSGSQGGVRTSGSATASVLMLDTAKANPTWERLPDLPSAREGGAAAVVGGRLYVMGGQDRGSDLNDALALELATPTSWKTLDQPPPLDLTPAGGRTPVARAPIGAFDYKGDVALLWTVFDDSPAPPFAGSHTHLYSTRDAKWTRDDSTLPGMRTPRRWTSVAALGSLAMVAGGDRQRVAEGDALPGSTVYSVPTVEYFDMDARKWFAWPDMPTGRSECATAGASGSFYVAGGVDQLNSTLDVVERFDVSRKVWLPAPALREARSAFPLLYAGGKLWAIGGSPGRGIQRNPGGNYGGLALKSVETLAVGSLP